MKMKTFKQRVLREKEHPNIYMQKTQGTKPYISSPNHEQRFKSKTGFDKENHQPNIPSKMQKYTADNTFGAAKMMMRQSVDDMKLQLNRDPATQSSTQQSLQFSKKSQPKYNFLWKSNNFQKCATQRIMNTMNAFSKKQLKTEEYEDEQNNCPIIQDCQFIRSEYQSSQQSGNDQRLNYAKCYQRPLTKNNHGKNIVIHESLNYDDTRPREIVTFGPSEAKNIKRYQCSRQEEKKIKNQIVNNIIMSSKAEMMRSCDFDNGGGLNCVNHNNKKAKYRLNAVLTEEEEECFYCSKCAVNLAKQGFDIEEISNVDRKMIMSRQPEREFLRNSVEIQAHSHREEELMTFGKRLETLKSKISAKLKLFSEKSEEMTKIDKKIEMNISNYDRLIEILKELRQKQVQKEERQKKQKSLDINLKKHELSTILDNIKDTAFEVNSQKTKLMSLKNKEFVFMFDSYVNKISSYEEYLTNLEQTQLAQQIAMFDENLDSEELDEEVMIQQIFDQMYKKLTNPKLQALGNISRPSIPSQKIQNPIKTQTDLQSGGSSMFFCEQEQETRPPFRILFENSQTQESMHPQRNHNMQQSVPFNENFNVNSSVENLGHRSVKYFKEENYLPFFHK